MQTGRRDDENYSEDRLKLLITDDNGAITVLLSLLFLVLIGLIFCVLGGMHDYAEEALAEDAVDGAGDYVTANYDKELYRRYHIFFLDPREKDYIAEDGENFINQYLDSGSFFTFQCNGISLSGEQSALDWEGKYLKSEIREYMKYQSVKDVADTVLNLMENAKSGDSKSGSLNSKVSSISNDETEEKKETVKSSSKTDDDKDKKSDSSDSDKQKADEEVETSQEVEKKRATWKSFKEMIEMALHTGTLTFVTRSDEALSTLSISDTDLPSKEHTADVTRDIKDPSFSVSDIHSFSNLLKGKLNLNTSSHLLSDEYYLLQYIDDCFSNYCNENEDEDSALKYEEEYLVAGKMADVDNLHYVLNRILLVRFVANFAHAVTSVKLQEEVDSTIGAIAGVLTLPIGELAVKYILLGALSYGETLIDLRTMCAGDKVPLVKSDETWNLYLENIASCFVSGYRAKKGSVNVSYHDYLTVLLAGTVKTETLYYRMMDLMQENVRLVESDFLMKDSLFSYQWNIEMDCQRWFTSIPVYGLGTDSCFDLNLERVVSY